MTIARVDIGWCTTVSDKPLISHTSHSHIEGNASHYDACNIDRKLVRLTVNIFRKRFPITIQKDLPESIQE